MQFTALLTAKTPLLLHQDNLDWQDKVKGWIEKQNRSGVKSKKASVKGDDRSPAFTWLGCLYLDNGQLTIPSEVIQKCFIQAASKIIKKGNTSYKGDLASSLFLHSTAFPLLVKGKPIADKFLKKLEEEEDYKVHCKAAIDNGFSLYARRAGVNGSKHVRVRPKFLDWSIQISGSLDSEEIDQSLFERICDVAGHRVGIGDWRPSVGAPGQHGMFDAKVAWGK